VTIGRPITFLVNSETARWGEFTALPRQTGYFRASRQHGVDGGKGRTIGEERHRGKGEGGKGTRVGNGRRNSALVYRGDRRP